MEDSSKIILLATQTFNAIVPVFDFDRKEIYRRFIATINYFLKYLLKAIQSDLTEDISRDANARRLLHKLGRYYRLHGEFLLALLSNETSILLHKKFAPLEDKSHLETMQNLGCVYLQIGRLEKAEKLFEEVITEEGNLIGTSSFDIGNFITANQNLALLYMQREEFDKAEESIKDTIEIQEKTIGAEHKYTLLAKNNLASLYAETDRINLAQILLEEVIEISERVSKNHPDLALFYINLGQMLQIQNIYDKASELYQKGLQIYENNFGREHHETIKALEFFNRLQELINNTNTH